MIIFAINLDVKKEDKKIDQLKSPLINQNIPKNPIRLFQKNEIVELKNIFVASVAYVQAIFILGLVGFIIYIYHKNKKKKIVSDKVLKL